ncbi:MAG: flagellar protein [Agathobacter sp.]|nr:flagellar protein [Agathobacter sp.]
MEVINCRNCGRIFNAESNERICPLCKKKAEEKFQEVKAYIEENPGASVEAVSKELSVSVKQIKKWIKEERLVLADGSLGGIICEKCGKSISTGRFCENCKKRMSDALQDSIAKPVATAAKPKDSLKQNRMHYLQ